MLSIRFFPLGWRHAACDEVMIAGGERIHLQTVFAENVLEK
jgi:hypothetical protein